MKDCSSTKMLPVVLSFVGVKLGTAQDKIIMNTA